MAKDAERAGLIPEAACGLRGRQSLGEVGAKGLVLALARVSGLKKEARFVG
jgi:hypothetical protein